MCSFYIKNIENNLNLQKKICSRFHVSPLVHHKNYGRGGQIWHVCITHLSKKKTFKRSHPKLYGFLFLLNMAQCAAQRESWSVSLARLSFLTAKRENHNHTEPRIPVIHQMSRVTRFYLSPEGLEVMTQSKYSLAAMESSTLFTSLVKLPSTCLLLNASPRLSISDLSMYTGT